MRETVLAFSQLTPSPFTGSPSTVANAIEQWFEQRALDGVNLGFRTNEEFDQFAGEVLPILQKRGLVRTDYEADTLRGNLGLPFAENRYTVARRTAESERVAAAE